MGTNSALLNKLINPLTVVYMLLGNGVRTVQCLVSFGQL